MKAKQQRQTVLQKLLQIEREVKEAKRKYPKKKYYHYTCNHCGADIWMKKTGRCPYCEEVIE